MPLKLDRKDQKEVMYAFHLALSQERHNLLERPKILWQQMYNRLQWADGEVKIGPVTQIVKPEFKKRTAPGVRPWLHNRCKNRELDTLVMTLLGHNISVASCVYSPDGTNLASAGKDHIVRLWDVVTGRERAVLEGHQHEVNCCAFSPDSKTLASAGNDQTVRLWDVATGRERAVLEGHPGGWIFSCDISQDGKLLASAGEDNPVMLWDVESGIVRAALKGHQYGSEYCCFSPNGKQLASTGAGWDYTIRLWQVANGKERKVLRGHSELVTSCVFSPDGKTLASVSWDKTVRLWDVSTGRERAVLKGHKNWVKSCAFSPDGKTLATAGGYDETIRLWDVNTGKELAILKDYTGGKVLSCAFNPGGKILASANGDKTVKLWVVDSSELIYTYPCAGEPTTISFNPYSKTIAAGDSAGNVYILEPFNFDFQQSNNELKPDHRKANAEVQPPEGRNNDDFNTVNWTTPKSIAILPEKKVMVPRRIYTTNFIVIILGLLFARGAYALIMISPWLWIISLPIFIIAALYILDGLKTKHYVCPYCRKQIFNYAQYREVCPNCKRKINIKA